ncbi:MULTISPECIES: hypothetical protein [Arthrobacter]|uniref:DUF2127 domain-containing protein n=1 Tax=Arthrobacter psychrochitiniphilus TaxID=291045 RepID=A0A2V3DTA7_9MICC|nr:MULTISPECIES: hypothetical protein [Arthrobacter]NYG18613.1 hypothetical protein [Arthrobacter psychrochitiniphilus]PXA66438.1 hypothetical protein CVS29_07105 [Arthrobacter psychrochitiniphilus]
MATPPKIPGLNAFRQDKPGTRRPVTPRLVTAAARLLWLAAIMQIVASVFALIHAASPDRRAALEEQIAAMAGKTPSIEAYQNMGVLTVVLAGLVTAGAYVFFSFYLTRGRTWARSASGVLVALTLIQLVGVSYPEGFTTLAQVVLGGVAVSLCYLPESSRFFAQVKASRS